MPTIAIRWSDNTDQLSAHLKQGLNQIEATKAAAEKMAKALAGDNLIRGAHNYAAAVQQIGGVEKLTNAERERGNTLLSKALEKYQALGREAPQALTDLAAATKRVGMSTEELQQSLQRFGTAAKSIGVGLTAAITAPLVGGGAAVVKLAMDFESSFAGVRKTVDATDAQFAEMAQQFRDLAKTIPVNVNELNRLGEAAGALGIPRDAIVDFARVMAELGVTTNVTSDQAAESIAKIQNIFGAAGKDTERFASTLVALGNAGASTESQILEMATRIAGAGNAVGISQGQVLAFASALSSVGIEAEMGGTAISKVFIEIASSVNKGGKSLQGFADVAGQSVTQFAQLFKTDAAAATSAFIDGLARIKREGGDLIGTIESLGFAEVRVRDTLLRAAGAGDLLTQALKLQAGAWQENTALTVEAQKRFETTASQLTLLWNRVKDVGITIGNALLPAIELLVGAAKRLLPSIDGVAKIFASLPAPVQLMGIAFLGLAAVIGPVIYLAGQLAISASAVAGAFATQGIAAGGLSAALRVLSTQLPTVAAGMRTVGGAAVLTSTQMTAFGLVLRGLGTLAAVAGAALAGWAIGRTIAQVFDLDTKIANLTARIMGLGNVQQQTQGAQQDAITLAIKRGAEATITYADAIAYNTKWYAQYQAAASAAAEATSAFTGPIQDLTSKNASLALSLQNAQKELSDLSAVAKRDLVKAIQSGAFSMEELHQATGLSEMALKLFKDQVADGAKATKDFAAAAKEAAKEQQKLTQEWMKGEIKQLAATLDLAAERAEELAKALERVEGETKPAVLALTDLGEATTTATDGTDDMIRQLTFVGPTLEMLTDWSHKAERGLGDLAQAFAQLAQISGGSFGGILQGLGQMIGSIDVVQKAMKNLGSASASTLTQLSSFIAIAEVFYTVGRSVQGFFDQFLPGIALLNQMRDTVAGIGSLEQFFQQFDSGADAIDRLTLAFMQAGMSAEEARAHITALMKASRGGAEDATAAIKAMQAALDHLAEIKSGASEFGLSQEERDQAVARLKEILDHMVKDGTYSKEAMEKVYYAWQKAMADAGDVAAQAWIKAHDAAKASTDAAEEGATKVSAAMQSLLDQRKRLVDELAKEAPEEFSGSIQLQQEADLARINEQIAAMEQQAAAAAAAAEASSKATGEAATDAGDTVTDELGGAIVDAAAEFDEFGPKAQDARSAIEEAFRTLSITIPVHFKMDGLPVVPDPDPGGGGSKSKGSFVSGAIKPWDMDGLTGPRGADRIPVWMSEGETVRTPRQEAALTAAGAGVTVGSIRVTVVAPPGVDATKAGDAFKEMLRTDATVYQAVATVARRAVP